MRTWHHLPVAGTLYLVGTPIGNLGDMTDRARSTLASVGVVAAEDTRRTGSLLKRFGIDARMVSFHEANERERSGELLAALEEGADVAVVSDARRPGLSGPGVPFGPACAGGGGRGGGGPGASPAGRGPVVSWLPPARL